MTVAAYTAGIPLLAPSARMAGQRFLTQELSHAGELSGLVRQAGGVAIKAREGYDLGHPRNGDDVLKLLHELERSQIAAYLQAIPKVSMASTRAALAAVMANDAQHISVLRSQLGRQPVPDRAGHRSRVGAGAMHPPPGHLPTRRELLGGAIAAVAAGSIAAAALDASEAVAAAETDPDLLRAILSVELLLVFCYQQVLQSETLAPEAEPAIRHLLSQEQTHIDVMSDELAKFGQLPPSPPSGVAAADGELDALHASGSLTRASHAAGLPAAARSGRGARPGRLLPLDHEADRCASGPGVRVDPGRRGPALHGAGDCCTRGRSTRRCPARSSRARS